MRGRDPISAGAADRHMAADALRKVVLSDASLQPHRPRFVVLTGGPGGGKTTLMEELRAEDPRGERWVLVPEAAPLLFRAGLDGRRKAFQRAVVTLQIALETVCAEAARPGQVLLCHRGTLDPLAYWMRNGWERDEFFDLTGLSPDGHLRRYDAVIHLQTAAIEAEDHYRCGPEAHRPESPQQAAEIDRWCVAAWSDHPAYVRIENTGVDWMTKAQRARGILTRSPAGESGCD